MNGGHFPSGVPPARIGGPPPVPLRLQHERQRNRYIPTSPEKKVQFEQPQIGGRNEPQYDQRTDVETRLLTLERRLVQLENEKRADAERFQSMLVQVQNNNVHGSEVMNGSSLSDQTRDIMMSQENKMLKSTLADMSKHISSLEEMIIDRDKRMEAYGSRLASLQNVLQSTSNTENDLAELKNMIVSRSESTDKHGSELVGEVARLGKVCALLNERMDKTKQALDQSLQEMGFREQMTAQRLGSVANKERESADSQRAWVQSVGAQVEEVRAELLHVKSHLDENAKKEFRNQDTSTKMMEDLRDALVRMEAKFAEKLTAQMQDVELRLNHDRNSEKERHSIDKGELMTEIMNMRDSNEIDRRQMDVRLQKVQEQVIQKRAIDDARIAEIRQETNTKLEELASEVNREEASRIDGVRRIHEDLLEQLNSERNADGIRLEIQSLSDKVLDLEEIVRAEVRSRMRHESKAREHVENTAKGLHLNTETSRKEIKDWVKKALHASDAETRQSVKQLLTDVDRIESKVLKESHQRLVSEEDIQERLSSCEAKVAKRAALHQMELDNLERSVAEKLDSVHQTIEKHNERLQHLRTSTDDRFTETKDNARMALLSTEEKMGELKTQMLLATETSITKLHNAVNVQVDELQGSVQKQLDEINSNVQATKQDVVDAEERAAVDTSLQNIIAQIVQEAELISAKDARDELHKTISAQVGDQVDMLQGKINEQQNVSDELKNSVRQLTTSLEGTSELIENKSKAHTEEREKLHQEIISHIDKTDRKLQDEIVAQSGLIQEDLGKLCVQSTVENVISKIIETSNTDNLEKLQNDMEETQLFAKSGLERVTRQVKDEHEITRRLEENIQAIFNSIEAERQEQDALWEKSVEEAKSLFLDNEMTPRPQKVSPPTPSQPTDEKTEPPTPVKETQPTTKVEKTEQPSPMPVEETQPTTSVEKTEQPIPEPVREPRPTASVEKAEQLPKPDETQPGPVDDKPDSRIKDVEPTTSPRLEPQTPVDEIDATEEDDFAL